MNGFSTGEEDSRGPNDQICCLIDDDGQCVNKTGNAAYSKRIQKTVSQRKLKLLLDPLVSFSFSFIFNYTLCLSFHRPCCFFMFNLTNKKYLIKTISVFFQFFYQIYYSLKLILY